MRYWPISILWLRVWIIAVASVWFLHGAAAAPKSPSAAVSAELNYSALPPGQQGVVAVVVDIPSGLHAQSHTPSQDSYIRFEVVPDANSSVRLLAPQYPSGRDVTYPLLGTLNVYTGRVVVFLPLEVNRDAQPGELPITGKVRYQLCDEVSCYRPETVPFSLTTRVVSAGTAVEASQSELFAGFSPGVFSAAPSTSAVPASRERLAGGTAIQFLGWSFELAPAAYPLAMGLAFVIGIVFNLMPCVLPVVPLKAMGFYEVSKHNRTRCLLLGSVFSLGLLAVFAVLAVLVIVYQAAWGQQFSKPWFVWSMVTILTIFAMGMFGAFSVILPASVYRFTPNHETYTGNFLFGAFTALLSTPCTAPMFLGLLVWAGRQPQWLGISSVMVVGLGMAFPYLLLSAFPELARRFPRTGPWSELIKQLMGFLILAVAVYFAAGRLIPGRLFFWMVYAVIVGACVFLVVRTLMLTTRARPRGIAIALAVLTSATGFWFTHNLTSAGGVPWQPYSQAAFDAARKEGRIVLVEFTANWCANCLELDARVFRDPRTAKQIQAMGVVPLRADLTQDDAAGWVRLRQINPSGGIPLTAIYHGTAERPILLSSIYTTESLVRALEHPE